ncbi:PTS sugar transporter subunit IIB [Companilactobacillus sp. HBUAS59544]|uniref:PTS sugar transporter subunit IIB n=1 Tax=Companilactobacillus sp. HBUAS59544 TaxID=3109363 RepID=UPI002FEF3459
MSIKIKLVRVDNRLLHATVALNWTSFVNANYISIVDPGHTDDPFLTKVLQLSLPKEKKINIFSVDQLLNFLKNNEIEECNLIIIFKDLQSLRNCVEKGFWVNEVQLPYPASRIMLKKIGDYFSANDLKHIRYIQDKKIKFFFQTAPYDSKDYSIFN